MKTISAARFILIVASFISFAFVTLDAHADGAGSSLGILYGLSVPDMPNTNPHDLWGIKGSTFIVSSFSIGGYYLLSRFQQGNSGLPFDYTVSGIEWAYHMPNGGGDTFLGLRAGLTKIHQLVNGNDLIYSPYHYGIVLGYDYLLASVLNLGFEGSYLHAESASTTAAGTQYTEPKFGLMNFLMYIAIKF